MPETTAEQEIVKTSKKTAIQDRVNKIREGLIISNPRLTLPETNQIARNEAAKLIRIEKLREEVRRAKEKAKIDELTGLNTRAEFQKRLIEEVSRARRNGAHLYFLFLDANDLRGINNARGHREGDRELIRIANALKKISRKTDIVARMGEKADEFAVLLPDTNIEGAKKYWERLNEDFETQGISISAGLIKIDLTNPVESIAKADEAMQKAKVKAKGITGKNEIEIVEKAYG